jgi:hypothetical protein
MQYTKFATQIDENVLRELRAYAATADRSISKIVSEAVAEYLQRVQIRPAFVKAMNEVLEEDADLLRRLAK